MSTKSYDSRKLINETRQTKMIIRVRFVKLSEKGEADINDATQWVCYSERDDMTTFSQLFDKIHSGIFNIRIYFFLKLMHVRVNWK